MSAAYSDVVITPVRHKQGGAATKRRVQVRNHNHAHRYGWRESMEKAAAEIDNRKWDPINGWEDRTAASVAYSSQSYEASPMTADLKDFDESMKVASSKLDGRRRDSDLGRIGEGVYASTTNVPRNDNDIIYKRSVSDTVEFCTNLSTHSNDNLSYVPRLFEEGEINTISSSENTSTGLISEYMERFDIQRPVASRNLDDRDVDTSSYAMPFRNVAPRFIDDEGKDEKINIYDSANACNPNYWI